MTGARRNMNWVVWLEVRLQWKAIKGRIGHMMECGLYPEGNEEPLKDFTSNQKLL